jgi:hypothetical protein
MTESRGKVMGCDGIQGDLHIEKMFTTSQPSKIGEVAMWQTHYWDDPQWVKTHLHPQFQAENRRFPSSN